MPFVKMRSDVTLVKLLARDDLYQGVTGLIFAFGITLVCGSSIATSTGQARMLPRAGLQEEAGLRRRSPCQSSPSPPGRRTAGALVVGRLVDGVHLEVHGRRRLGWEPDDVEVALSNPPDLLRRTGSP